MPSRVSAIRCPARRLCHALGQPKLAFSTLKGLAKKLVVLEHDNGNCLNCVFWLEKGTFERPTYQEHLCEISLVTLFRHFGRAN
jgi:hypothetical protein